MKLKLQVVTPEKLAFTGEADGVSLPTKSGQITILPRHIALVSTIKSGALVVKQGAEEVLMAVHGGFVEVKNDEVLVMTNLAERVEEIDEAKAEAARQEAQKRLQELDKADNVAFADAAALLEKSLLQLKVVRRKYNRHL